jgi:hypothetical protein
MTVNVWFALAPGTEMHSIDESDRVRHSRASTSTPVGPYFTTAVLPEGPNEVPCSLRSGRRLAHANPASRL